MKDYIITLQGKEITITQNEDGTFNTPDFITELKKQGTALKPAFEPICMARKPLSEKTVAENCLKWGTGGINIDESRVGYQSEQDFENAKGGNSGSTNCNIFSANGKKQSEKITSLGRFPANLIHDNSEEVRECFPDTKSGKFTNKKRQRNKGWCNSSPGDGVDAIDNYGDSGNASRFFKSIPQGRFPANLIHDNSEEVRECFPESKGDKKVGKNTVGQNGVFSGRLYGEEKGLVNETDRRIVDGGGNASRFFKSIIYQAKASKRERQKGCEGLETSQKFTAGNYSQSPTCKDCNLTLNGTNDHSKCSGEVYYKEMDSKNTKNNHPCVKPIALMEYLINMVTPNDGTVLDPFMGSGTTGVACKNLNRKFIGIEMNAEYIEIAKARIDNEREQLKLNYT